MKFNFKIDNSNILQTILSNRNYLNNFISELTRKYSDYFFILYDDMSLLEKYLDKNLVLSIQNLNNIPMNKINIRNIGENIKDKKILILYNNLQNDSEPSYICYILNKKFKISQEIVVACIKDVRDKKFKKPSPLSIEARTFLSVIEFF